MPLGGLGTGTISICGDGSLRQWEVVNLPNHRGFIPLSFFAIWIEGRGALLLQSKPFSGEFEPGVMVTDHEVPGELARLAEELPTFARTRFVGEYPLARVLYEDEGVGEVEVELTAFNPLVPLNAKDSSLPLIVLSFRVRNTAGRRLRVSLAASLLNFIGWDGVEEIGGSRCNLFCGNWNELVQRNGYIALVMRSSSVERASPRWGEIALAVRGVEGVTWMAEWSNLSDFWACFSEDGRLPCTSGGRPSGAGETWAGSLALSRELEPGEEGVFEFVIAWYFPNRYVNWDQPFSPIQDPGTMFWVGNMYAENFKGGVVDVLEYLFANFDKLESETLKFHEAFYDSTLPRPILDRVSAGISILRSPTCFWASDGRFYGFEGCRGASAGGRDSYGGCCPLNCTHVWNYEQTLSRLFPELERSMREVELLYQQSPEGYIPHRVVLPLYLPRPWSIPIGGPEKPALDGMLGTVLKVYREYLWGAGREWLERLWPRLRKLMSYVLENYEMDENGVLWGEQPHTYDVSAYGANTFIGSLYLASLLAMARMAEELGDEAYAKRMAGLFEKASRAYDEECWNGEYYIQVCGRGHEEFQWLSGCLSDQLLGQWWAALLGLGYVLPRDHVRRALRSIVEYNWRPSFRGFTRTGRIFAHEDHPGLLNCTWPRGGRPERPVLYCDEVWTGVEYEVAALLLWEGMFDDAMKLVCSVEKRYDGERMNPWNEVECGDHYVRAMSSWSLLEAALGYRYEKPTRSMYLKPNVPTPEVKGFMITPDGWGSVEYVYDGGDARLVLDVKWGRVELAELHLKCPRPPIRVEVADSHVAFNWRHSGDELVVEFVETVVEEGERLVVIAQLT